MELIFLSAELSRAHGGNGFALIQVSIILWRSCFRYKLCLVLRWDDDESLCSYFQGQCVHTGAGIIGWVARSVKIFLLFWCQWHGDYHEPSF